METYQVVLGLIVSMAIIVGIYYLLKILIAYVGHALLWGIGVGFAFLVICNYIAPDYMIEVGLVGSYYWCCVWISSSHFTNQRYSQNRLCKKHCQGND